MGKVTRLLPREALRSAPQYKVVLLAMPRRCAKKGNGAYGIRTRDLLNAIEALYQLS